jgi:hypothetical protein
MAMDSPGRKTKVPTSKPERETFELSAIVGPGSLTNAAYSFSIAGWNVQDRSLSMIFYRQIPIDFEDIEIYLAVQDLENILFAMFVNDRLPRKIFHFSYPSTLEKEISSKLLFMLGQVNTGPGVEKEVATESFSHSGFMFNRRLGEDWIPSNSSIEEWFNFFCKNESLAGSIMLFQKSFWTINGLYGKYRYYDYLDLCESVVLMIAGLESLFVPDFSETISSQFKRVGSAYYTKHVSEDYFNDFNDHSKKLCVGQVSKLLGSLYGIRSAVAHGQARSLFSGKKSNRGRRWLQIIKWMNVAEKNPADKTMFFSHFLLAMGLFQKHIFAIISRLKDHPVDGLALQNSAGEVEDCAK